MKKDLSLSPENCIKHEGEQQERGQSVKLNPTLNLSTAQLEYFVAAMEHETWGDAATAVGVSASAMSQGMAELQKRLGVQLFNREGRRMVPLPAADQVLSYARRVLTETRDLERWVAQARDGSTGRVTIGMIDTAAVHYCSEALAQFRSSRPDVDLRLRVQPSAALVRDLNDGLLDLAVGVERDGMSADGLVLTPLVDEGLFVYAPAGQQSRRPAKWGPWVSFPADSHSRRSIERALRDLGVTVEVVAESSQPDVLREMVRLGVGWAVLPPIEAERPPHPLVPARQSPVASRRIALMERSTRRLNPAAAELKATLLRST